MMNDKTPRQEMKALEQIIDFARREAYTDEMHIVNEADADIRRLRAVEAERDILRELLASIRETRHMGSFAVAGHVAAALDLCEEQLAALKKVSEQ